MNTNIIRTLLFFVVMIGYLLFPFYSISSYQNVLTDGEVFRFRPAPVDPYDAFRGKYVRLDFPQNRLVLEKGQATFKRDQDIFLTLKEDSLGYTQIDKAFHRAPENTPNYIKTRTLYNIGSSVYFQLPFDKYFLNEELAPLAEKKARELTWNRDGNNQASIYMDVRVKNGKALIEELYFEGIPIKEYLHTNEK